MRNFIRTVRLTPSGNEDISLNVDSIVLCKPGPKPGTTHIRLTNGDPLTVLADFEQLSARLMSERL
jgi:hypothetical protein